MSSAISCVSDSQVPSIPSSDNDLSEISAPDHSEPFLPTDLEFADNARTCVLYEEDRRQAFLAWWCQTSWAINVRNKTSHGKSIMSWASTGRNAQCWKQFNQIAVAKTGCPKLQCIACGSILEHPSPKHTGTNSMTRHLSRSSCKRRARDIDTETGQNIQQSFSKQAIKNRLRITGDYTDETFVEVIISFLTALRLPLETVNHTQFYRLISLAQKAPTRPVIPSPKAVRRHIQQSVELGCNNLLEKFPAGASISLALDCWSSTFRQGFLAITGYFIDADWISHEVLLGFEHVQGNHTGKSLNNTLISVLDRYNIRGRVLAITTDNASNNNTLMKALNQELDKSVRALFTSQVSRIPCLAHVIQLCVKSLMKELNIDAKNETTELGSADNKPTEDIRKAQGIGKALAKTRGLSKYTNGSNQRKEGFRKVQIETGSRKHGPLNLLLDCKTRWNSTPIMLKRTHKLRSDIDIYQQEFNCPELVPSPIQWKQIEYLLDLTRPFMIYTNAIGKTSGPTIHNVFEIYDRLFEHIETSADRLSFKQHRWKFTLHKGLLAARDKLKKYFSNTSDSYHGNIYACAALLDPSKKVTAFDSRGFSHDERERFVRELKCRVDEYNKKGQQVESRPRSDQPIRTHSALAKALNKKRKRSDPQEENNEDCEVTRYLQESTSDENILTYWRHRQLDFPVLARIARDLLAIPAAGVGVERLFNSSRDICHYRRGRLRPETIRILMMKLCMTRFELDEDLQAIKAELPDQSDDETSNDSDSSDDDEGFRYISDIEDDHLAEDTDDDLDGIENHSREFSFDTQDNARLVEDNSEETIEEFLDRNGNPPLPPNKRIRPLTLSNIPPQVSSGRVPRNVPRPNYHQLANGTEVGQSSRSAIEPRKMPQASIAKYGVLSQASGLGKQRLIDKGKEILR